MQFATNHMGHFLLTCLLVPALRAGAPARIVNLSSRGHRFSDVDFDDPNYERRPYDKFEPYGQSKTANVLFSVELTRRLAKDGITANAVHPAVIMTELSRHMDADDMKTLRANAPSGALTLKSVEVGAATSVWAASSPELEGKSSLYLQDCQIATPPPTRRPASSATPPTPSIQPRPRGSGRSRKSCSARSSSSEPRFASGRQWPLPRSTATRTRYPWRTLENMTIAKGLGITVNGSRFGGNE
jgi:hypothetical protein